MFYVYILQSKLAPQHFYVGYTADLKRRVFEHNNCDNGHTKKHRPWQLVTYLAFDCSKKARNFEEYLKTASGRNFAKKRL